MLRKWKIFQKIDFDTFFKHPFFTALFKVFSFFFLNQDLYFVKSIACSASFELNQICGKHLDDYL